MTCFHLTQHIYRWYSDWLLGSNDEVEFEEKEISLGIDENGTDIRGWTIFPFNSITVSMCSNQCVSISISTFLYLQISEHQVERHHNSSGGRVPHCHLELLWNGDGEHKRLMQRIYLDGAKKGHNFVTLDTNHFQTGGTYVTGVWLYRGC